MRILLLSLLFFPLLGLGQSPTEDVRFLSRLKPGPAPPEGMLSSRAVVLFSPEYSQRELEEIQTGFQQIGIDAVSYVESERALAGKDMMNAYGRYFKSREIRLLVFLKKDSDAFRFNFVPFNARSSWVDAGQTMWSVNASTLRSTMVMIFRALASAQKRQNFLINDFPERSGPLSVIGGRREEDFPQGLKVVKMAVPRFGDPEADKDLEDYLRENVHAKYEFVDPDVSEKDLLDKEFIYVLRFIHTRGSLAKEILGYDLSKSESALATVNYANGNLQLKTIPATNSIFKFYVKNIEEDTYYLGRKWDADMTWQHALKNYVDGCRAAGRLN